MLPNLYTSFYGNFGNKPLKKELPKILKIIKDESVQIDLKTSLINYVVRRAAMQNIEINYKYYEKLFLNLTSNRKERGEYIDYGDCCFAFAFYFYKNNIYPKKALRYLKESIRYPMDESHLYSRYILLAYFYLEGFGLNKDVDKAVNAIFNASKLLFSKGGIIDCDLTINQKPIKI